MRLLYTLILFLLTPFVLVRLAWLGRRSPAYLERWLERFGLPPVIPEDRPVIWLHAVSVGEVLAAKPLLNRLLERYPSYRIVVTTTTPTGALTVQQNFPGNVQHLYFPYDLPCAVRGSLARIHPSIVIIMETEIWPNFFAACRLRGLPLALVNARLSERSARGYRQLFPLARDTLRAASLIAVQSQSDAQRFQSLGADPERVIVCGNVKFDAQLPRSVMEQGQALRRFFSVNRPIWIAASTHEGEEARILQAFRTILRTNPECLLILAPRHPERTGEVIELNRRFGFQAVRRSTQEHYGPETQVFILDSVGELQVFYASSDVAFVGGSLVPAGGHNLLEPASLGLPVISGPHLFNFASVSESLVDAGAMLIVANEEKLAVVVSSLLGDPNLRYSMGQRAQSVFKRNQGCTELLLRNLHSFLISRGSNVTGKVAKTADFRGRVPR